MTLCASLSFLWGSGDLDTWHYFLGPCRAKFWTTPERTAFFFFNFFLFQYKFVRNPLVKLIKMESIFKILKFLNYFPVYLSVLFYAKRCGQLWHIRFVITMDNKVFPG